MHVGSGSAGTGTKSVSQFANVEAPVVLLICPHINSHAEDCFIQDFVSVYRVSSNIGEVYFGCPIWGAMEVNSAIYDSCSPNRPPH